MDTMNYIDFVDRDRYNTSLYHNEQLPNTNINELLSDCENPFPSSNKKH